MKCPSLVQTQPRTFTPFTGASFINDSQRQPKLHVNHPRFSSLTSRILFWALLHYLSDSIVMGSRLGLLRRPYFLQD